MKLNVLTVGMTETSKKAPVKLRKKLVELIKNSLSTQTEDERLMNLRKGIRKAVRYLQNIKEDENYLNSIALQDVYEHLSSLLEIKIFPLQPEDLPMEE